MCNLSILRNTMKLNATVITGLQNEARWLKIEAADAKKDGDISISIELYGKHRKERAKLSKAVALQRSVKVEMLAIFCNERIARKHAIVFGKPQSQQVLTSFEQEAMLDTLIKEMSSTQALAIAE